MSKQLLVPILFLAMAHTNVYAESENQMFFQMIVDDFVIGQAEGFPQDDCKSVHNKELDGVKMVCSAESKESELPYTYTGQNTVSGAVLVYRARTMKFCQLMKEGNSKNSGSSIYTFTECK